MIAGTEVPIAEKWPIVSRNPVGQLDIVYHAPQSRPTHCRAARFIIRLRFWKLAIIDLCY